MEVYHAHFFDIICQTIMKNISTFTHLYGTVSYNIWGPKGSPASVRQLLREQGCVRREREGESKAL